MELYTRYGKCVPEAVFDTDFFDDGKRIPFSDMDPETCLCPANPDIILDFAARAVMKETRGIDVDAPLDEKQERVRRDVERRLKGAIDGLGIASFRGRGMLVTVSWA